MQLAKDEVHSISVIARILVNRQVFKSDAMAFASQAERTLNRYSGGYTFKGATSSGYRSDGGYRSDMSTGSCDIGWRNSYFGYPRTWLFIPLELLFSVTPSSSGIQPEGKFRYWFRRKMVPIFRFVRHTKMEPVLVVGQDSGPFWLLPTADLYPIQPERNHAVTSATISATLL
jgi:hypothetical protein